MFRRQFFLFIAGSFGLPLIDSNTAEARSFTKSSKKIKFEIIHNDSLFLECRQFAELRLKAGNHSFYNNITSHFEKNKKLISKKVEFTDKKITVEFTFSLEQDAEEFIATWKAYQPVKNEVFANLGYIVKHV